MTTLQAYLLSRSALLFPSIRPLRLSPLHISCHSVLSTFARPLKFPIGCCTLHPEQPHHRDDANFSSDSKPVSTFDVGDIPTKFDNPVAPVDDNGSLTMEGQNQRGFSEQGGEITNCGGFGGVVGNGEKRGWENFVVWVDDVVAVASGEAA